VLSSHHNGDWAPPNGVGRQECVRQGSVPSLTQPHVLAISSYYFLADLVLLLWGASLYGVHFVYAILQTFLSMGFKPSSNTQVMKVDLQINLVFITIVYYCSM
jgi:hypothetical protein